MTISESDIALLINLFDIHEPHVEASLLLLLRQSDISWYTKYFMINNEVLAFPIPAGIVGFKKKFLRDGNVSIVATGYYILSICGRKKIVVRGQNTYSFIEDEICHRKRAIAYANDDYQHWVIYEKCAARIF